MEVLPISPDKCFALREKLTVPPIVITVINELIAINFDGERAVIFVEEIIKEVQKRDSTLTEDVMYKNHYLDIEDLYIEQGWTRVLYMQPTTDKDYFEPYFSFLTYND